MGLLQRALETYESHLCMAETQNERTPMAPVAHIVTRAHIEITLDPDGVFLFASAIDKAEPKIIIPATETSAGRTIAPCAHPLCEQLGYLIPQNAKKYKLYVDQLAAWNNSEYTHPKLQPILRYVERGTILEDLVQCGLVKKKENGMPEQDKLMIRWRVQGENIEECWRDRTLFAAYTNYSLNQIKRQKGLCMVTGEEVGIAQQHPKGIVSHNGNAKLISANDSSGFTYRGRIAEEWQAAQVGYETSQKAHNALRWLVQEQSVIHSGRTFLCWNPQGKRVTPVTLPFQRAETILHPTDYRDALKKTLESKKRDFRITDGIVMAVFDAATTGRLSITYYHEFGAHDFFQRLYDWDMTCCWYDWRFGTQSPSLQQIIDCAFGTQRIEKDVAKLSTDEKIVRQEIQRLAACRVERAAISADVVKALVNKASEPVAYKSNVWETILSTACAVVRKYRFDRFQEEWNMALEPKKKDRSYQFGRLIAVMEKAERDAYDKKEEREPNAIRMYAAFRKRPIHTAGILEEQLENAYFKQLRPGLRSWYKSLIGQIMQRISEFPQESWDRPLEDSYLMGYYLQRDALYTKNSRNTEEEEYERAE